MLFQDQQNIYSNMIDGVEAFELFKLIKSGSSLLYIVSDDVECEKIASRLSFFIDSARVIQIKSDNFEPYAPISPTPTDSYHKIFNLSKILLQNSNDKVIVIASVVGLLQKIITQEALLDNSLFVSIGDNIPRTIYMQLSAMGYIRAEVAEYSGQFALRGSILDIVPDEADCGYRLDFIGDTLDSIKAFAPDTQISYKKLTHATILPVSEVIFSDKNIETFKQQYAKYFGNVHSQRFEAIANKVREYGIENWLPLFYEKMASIFDYMPKNFLCIFEKKAILHMEELHSQIEEQYTTRLKTPPQELIYRPLVPTELFLMPDELQEKLSANAKEIILFSNYDAEGSTSVDAKILYHRANIEEYIEQIKDWNRKNPNVCILIGASDEGSKSQLIDLCKRYDFPLKEITKYEDIKKGAIGITPMDLPHSFSYENFILIAETDLLGQRQKAKKNKRSKDAKRLLQAINELQADELVVHSDYGLGIFKGLKALEINGVIHDFLELIYHNDDKLYLPVENFELLTKYGSNELNVQLDRLGASNWQMRKAKLKERIKIAAEVLLKTAAIRQEMQATPLFIEHDIYSNFCKRFPYTETEDQIRAIDETISDLSSVMPMDRLICGDVGFGKTEVALRAASIAVLGEKHMQVAVVVPTTLLSRQHLKTFTERFDGYHLSIKQLSKFTKRGEIKDIKESLKSGKVDIIIGTHALLAKDIEFKNLGLVIIDEEQHFGVGQKEKLKQLKNNAHILTLSATPIPRTLQMSIVGIKELSIIATPPVERLPVKTFVIPYDDIIIKNALLKEKARNGRVFYITPRIAYLEKLARQLADLVPEMKVAVAHGSLSPSTLDDIMNDFYDGKYDILLSTAIVESGLDIPLANTLIVDRADMFGLAQLYQIRGRVGRSNIPAFAYLTIPKSGKTSSLAEKKLSIMQSLNELGSAMNLASYDMDIRGFGNLLGEEQSGHIKEVGIELYQSMLADAVSALKADGHAGITEGDWSPIINLDLPIQIPTSYISDDVLRLSLYRKIANLDNKEDIDSFIAEMTDRFGKIPEETENLFKVVELKRHLKSANIMQLDFGKKGILLRFREKSLVNHDKIIQLVNKQPNCKLRQDGSLIIGFNTDIPDNSKDGREKMRRIKEVIELASSLS